MKKWEYLEDTLVMEGDLYDDGFIHCFWEESSGDFDGIVAALDYYGADGWELIRIKKDTYLFKREKYEV